MPSREIREKAGRAAARLADESIVPRPSAEIDDAVGTPQSVIDARPSEAQLILAPERPTMPHCEFVNTDNNTACGNAAKYICSLSGIVERILVCSVHSRPFRFKVGSTVVPLSHRT